MNEYDVKNAKKILALRKALNFTFNTKGMYTRDEIDAMSDDELINKIKTFEKNKAHSQIEAIKKKVDLIFHKWATDKENMILIGVVGRSDYHLYNYEDYHEMLYSTNWCWEKYNDSCFPVWHETSEDGEDLPDDFYHEHFSLLEMLEKTKLTWKADGDVFDASEDGINEYWNGYVAITRDYKIVAFIMRDDGMLSDQGYYEVDTLSVEEVE